MKNFLFVLFTFYNLDALKFDNKNIGLTAAVCLTSMAAISAGIAYSLVQPPSSQDSISQEPTSISAIKFTSSNQSVIQISSNKNISSVFLTNETVHNLIKNPNDFSTEIKVSVTYGKNIETVKLSYGTVFSNKIFYLDEFFKPQKNQQILYQEPFSTGNNQNITSNQTLATYESFFLDIVNFAIEVKKQEQKLIDEIVSTSAPTFAPNSTNSTNVSTNSPTFTPNNSTNAPTNSPTFAPNSTTPKKNKTNTPLISLTTSKSAQSFSLSQSPTETKSKEDSLTKFFSSFQSPTKRISSTSTSSLSKTGNSLRNLVSRSNSRSQSQSIRLCSSDSDCTVGKCYNNHCILMGLSKTCTKNTDCSSNFCSSSSNSCKLGYIGVSCSNSCGFSEYLTCSSSSFCQRTNTSNREYGASCSSDSNCNSGLYCSKELISSSTICVAGIPYNICLTSNQCKNSACVSYSSYQICSPGGLGDPCDEDKHCMNGLICYKNQNNIKFCN